MSKPLKEEWKIGEIANRLDTTARTLRHYETLGLLAPPTRTAASYRVYDNAALTRATLVMGLRRLGLPIADIGLALAGAPDDTALRKRLATLMERHIREADEEIAVLQGRREDLAARQRQLFETADDACLCRVLSVRCSCGKNP